MTKEQEEIMKTLVKKNADDLINLSKILSSRTLNDSELDLLEDFGDKIDKVTSLLKGFERECKIDEILDYDQEI